MKNTIIVGVLIMLGIGLFVFSDLDNKSKMEVEKEKMMMLEKEAMMKKEEAMMKKDGEAMVKEVEVVVKDEVMVKDGEAMKKEEVMIKEEVKTIPGSYVNYASANLANAKTNVLFFNASWCPSCRSAVKDINANLANIPAGMQIISVDYDSYQDLKKKYGVTSQHTFVKVDQQGNKIAMWSGGDFSDILVKAK